MGQNRNGFLNQIPLWYTPFLAGFALVGMGAFQLSHFVEPVSSSGYSSSPDTLASLISVVNQFEQISFKNAPIPLTFDPEPLPPEQETLPALKFARRKIIAKHHSTPRPKVLRTLPVPEQMVMVQEIQILDEVEITQKMQSRFQLLVAQMDELSARQKLADAASLVPTDEDLAELDRLDTPQYLAASDLSETSQMSLADKTIVSQLPASSSEYSEMNTQNDRSSPEPRNIRKKKAISNHLTPAPLRDQTIVSQANTESSVPLDTPEDRASEGDETYAKPDLSRSEMQDLASRLDDIQNEMQMNQSAAFSSQESTPVDLPILTAVTKVNPVIPEQTVMAPKPAAAAPPMIIAMNAPPTSIGAQSDSASHIIVSVPASAIARGQTPKSMNTQIDHPVEYSKMATSPLSRSNEALTASVSIATADSQKNPEVEAQVSASTSQSVYIEWPKGESLETKFLVESKSQILSEESGLKASVKLPSDGIWTKEKLNSNDFVPVVYLRAKGVRRPSWISNNTAELAKLAQGSSRKSDEGIVYGWAPSGWSVEASGTSVAAILFDEEGNTLSRNQTLGTKQFIFTGVKAGFQLVHLVHESNGSRVAVGIPVFGKAATFVDLSEPKDSSLSGIIQDATSEEEQILPYVQVNVVGQPSSQGVSNSQGQYRLEHVLRVQPYPLYIESKSSQALPHRYVISGFASVADLVRISQTQIQQWIDQNPNGFAEGTGLVLGAVPEWIQSTLKSHAKNSQIHVGIQSFQEAQYPVIPGVLSEAGTFMAGDTLDSTRSRFMSLNLPSGLNRIELKWGDGDASSWSMLVPASSGYVTVVGPQ